MYINISRDDRVYDKCHKYWTSGQTDVLLIHVEPH